MPRIHLTSEAREEARRAFAGGEPSVVTVSFAGGCGASGFLVRLTRNGIPDAEAFEVDGTLVCLDALAAERLDGATIVWSPGEGFVLLHPDAVPAKPC